MKIRKIQYNINFVHILKFQQEYKEVIFPYFALDNIRYAIDNENSIHETIRLVFENENVALILNKGTLQFVYEGDVAALKKSNTMTQIYFDIFEKVKKLSSYHKTVGHNMIVFCVDILSADISKKILEKPPYFTNNPYPNVNEFATIYEFTKDSYGCKLHFGNYSKKDLKIHDLMPFKTEYNSDLLDGVGTMARFEAKESIANSTFTKFKSLLSFCEESLSSFKLYYNE